ncbi:MAG: NitT/TauT family transport system permease protein [Mycobacteriales bacterium]
MTADVSDRVRTAAAVEARLPRRRGKWLGIWIPPLIVFGLFIGFWYLFTYFVLSPDRRFLVPPPHAVVQKSFFDADTRQTLFRALGMTTSVAMIGLVIAMVAGVTFAVLMSQARWIERSLYPYAVILQCVPIVALVPVIALWFDYGYMSRVIVCVLIALFPIISNTFFGLQSADQEQHDLFTLRGAGRLTRLFKLQLPAALPAIMTGFQVSATLSVIGAVVADFFFKQGEPGIGQQIELARAHLANEMMFGACILASALGVVVFCAFGILSRRLVGGWHGSAIYTKNS